MQNSTVISLDIDRTIVDRSKTSHEVDLELKKLLLLFKNKKEYKLVLNTGRDLLALAEFDNCIGVTFDAIFLSGRGSRINNQINIVKEAVLPTNLIEIILRDLNAGVFPYIDIKDQSGVLCVTSQTIGDHKIPFGVQKPRNWYSKHLPENIDLYPESNVSKIMDRLPLRIEVPVYLHNSKHPLAIASKTKDRELAIEYLGIPSNYCIGFLVPHKDFDSYTSIIGFLQILSPFEDNNKSSLLRSYCRIQECPINKIIHIGDSDHDHNNDSIVQQKISSASFIKVSSPDELPTIIKKILGINI